jgi:hypothetical protein
VVLAERGGEGDTWLGDLPEEAKDPAVVGRWRHFKGGRYRFCGVAADRSASLGGELVVYLDAEGKVWLRPRAMVAERVARATYDGPRFVRSMD